MDGHEGDRHAAGASQKFVSRTLLAAAIKHVPLAIRWWPIHRLIESAPHDMYLMAGIQQQRVWVIPSLDMVVVRIGGSGDRDPDEFACSRYCSHSTGR